MYRHLAGGEGGGPKGGPLSLSSLSFFRVRFLINGRSIRSEIEIGCNCVIDMTPQQTTLKSNKYVRKKNKLIIIIKYTCVVFFL